MALRAGAPNATGAAAAALAAPAPVLPMPPIIRVGVEHRPPLVYVQPAGNGTGGGRPSYDGFLIELWRLLLEEAAVSVPYEFWTPEVDVPGGRLVTDRNGTEYWTGEWVFALSFSVLCVFGLFSRPSASVGRRRSTAAAPALPFSRSLLSARATARNRPPHSPPAPPPPTSQQ